MSIASELPPLSLYIHIPWCERKCPYCDFNSHENFQIEQESLYIKKLIEDFDYELEQVQGRPLQSIFIGGGTPSIFSPTSIHLLLSALRERVDFSPDIEITLEANPASSQSDYFDELSETLVNRVSLGVQSFNQNNLNFLGRLHSSDEAHLAIKQLKSSFTNFNLDLMFGLQNQNIDQALEDLTIALNYSPPHLSWYQLTIEKNTVFYRQKPLLPDNDLCFDIHQKGIDLLEKNSYQHYEVSAFSLSGKKSIHNLNYWIFGDYIGIGAGAHGKFTHFNANHSFIRRTQKTRLPKDYLENTHINSKSIDVSGEELALEFLMNSLRLNQNITFDFFEKRTGLSRTVLNDFLDNAEKKALLKIDIDSFSKTSLGENHLDTLLSLY